MPTKRYRQGEDGYSSALITSIIEDDPSARGYNNATNRLGQISGSEHRILVRFGISGIPAGAVVKAVYLRMYHNGNQINTGPVYTHRMLVPWDQPTWFTRQGSSGWAAPGIALDGTDASIESSVTQLAGWSDANFPISLDLGQVGVDAVQAWIDGAANHGFLLRGSPETTARFQGDFTNSGESFKRPMLIVQYATPEDDAANDLPDVGDPRYYWLQPEGRLDTSMIVTWQEYATVYPNSKIAYRKRHHAGPWSYATGHSVAHPYTGTWNGGSYDRQERLVHHVRLDGLDPDTEYEWRFTRHGDTRWFRTLPSVLTDTSSVRFAAAGDVEITNQNHFMTSLIASTEPEFIVVKGDWAYADGLEGRFGKWDGFWGHFEQNLYRPDGRVIPLVPVIGNHEVTGGIGGKEAGPYFFTYFQYPGDHEGAYKEVRSGDYLSLLIVDSGHVAKYGTGSAQLEWLQDVLEETEGIPHRYPFWHLSFYPTRYQSSYTTARQELLPVLEDAGIRTAFDAHDHTYHRTPRIKAGSIDDDGIVYLGSGCWGVGVGNVTSANDGAWYIEEVHASNRGDAVKARHFYDITIDATKIEARSVASNGVVFHTYTDPVTYDAAPDPDPPPTPSGLVFAPAPSEPLTFAPAGATDEPIHLAALSTTATAADARLTRRARLGATSESVSAATGSFSRAVHLSAVSATATSASLQADASIRLAAVATVTTSASAGLTRRVQPAGITEATSDASAALARRGRMSSRADTYTSANAAVLRAVRMMGSTRAVSAAYATLTVGDPLPHPTTLGVTIEDIYTLAAIIED